jgi:Protein of unknown function (DUF3348)
VQNPQRTPVRGPTFIRLLARLADIGAPQSNPSLPDRLSQWLNWAHAIALSTALDGKPAATGSAAPVPDGAQEECARVRASLVNAIAGDQDLIAASQRGDETPPAAIDYKVFRQRYLARQRAMQAATGNLRGRLRDMLAQTSPDMARLAEVDAVMELALSPREHKLLATVPGLLGEHFERLRQAEQADPASATVPGIWLEVFRKDMQDVLLAELDIRFQPVEGLLAALRTS